MLWVSVNPIPNEIAKLIKTMGKQDYFDFACRIDSICKNPDVIKNLREAGAIKVLLGIENFNDNILKAWSKEITCSDIEEAIKIVCKVDMAFSASLILFHPKTTLEELKLNIMKIYSLNISNKIENLFNKLILIPGTRLNPEKELKEWNFENYVISVIYQKCLEFRKKIENCVDNINISIMSREDSINCLLKIFDLSFNRKVYEFYYLKSLVYDTNYSESNVLCDEKVMLNDTMDIIKNSNGNYLCINKNHGMIYEINQNTYNIMKNINNTRMYDLCSELTKNRYLFREKNLLITYIIFIILDGINVALMAYFLKYSLDASSEMGNPF